MYWVFLLIIQGLAFTPKLEEGVQMHFCSHLASTHATAAGFTLPLDNSVAVKGPPWQSQMHESQALFSAEYELGGNAIAKAWGMAYSPLGDLVATCTTLHPADRVAYLIPAEHRSLLAINRLGGSDGSFSLPKDGGLSRIEGRIYSRQ